MTSKTEAGKMAKMEALTAAVERELLPSRVAWRHRATGATGHGNWVSLKLAQDASEYGNKAHADIAHWVERR